MTFDPPPPPFSDEAPPPEEVGPRPDPGTPQAAMLSWILGAILIGTIVFFNQFTSRPVPAPAPTSAAAATGGDADMFTFYAKALTKLNAGGYAPDAASKEQLITNIDQSAQTPQDRLRSALVAADIGGTAKGEERLTLLANDPKAPAETKEQIPLFRKTIAGDAPALSSEEREQLVKEHGWFGKLALTRGMPMTEPEREKLVGGAGKLLALGGAGMILGLVAVLGGFGCCIAMIIMLATGKVRSHFEPPAPGGSVYLEMIPVFASAFLGVKLGLPAVMSVVTGSSTPPDWAIVATLCVQWMLIGIIAWPRIRGVPWSRARQDLGWHSGRGVMREILAGVFGYFAALPLLFLSMGVTVVYVIIRNAAKAARGEPVTPPDNAILEMVTKSDTLELVLIFALATIWAPLVEETLFRGAMFRHLRSRVPMLVAAVISAIAFGVMHGYEFFMLLPVMTLGFIFAMLREWRGSLIGSMFVHGLHNATVMTLLLTAMSVLKD